MQPASAPPVIEVYDLERNSSRALEVRSESRSWIGRKWECISDAFTQTKICRLTASYALTGCCFLGALVIAGFVYFLFIQIGSLAMTGKIEDFQKDYKAKIFILEPFMGFCVLASAYVIGLFCWCIGKGLKDAQESIYDRL